MYISLTFVAEYYILLYIVLNQRVTYSHIYNYTKLQNNLFHTFLLLLIFSIVEQ